MGQKVNFSGKNKKVVLLKKIGIGFLAIFILYILIRSVNNVRNELKTADKNINNQVTSYNAKIGYSSLEEILLKYNAEFIRVEETKELTKIYLNFNYDLFTEEKSNESYFNNIVKILATFLNYKNFELVDESRSIDIKVYCEGTNIVGMLINDDPNYYLNQATNNNKKKEDIEITRFTVQSPELKALIDGKWDEAKVDWGTKESTCDKYQIYFDEGIKYMVVSRQVYNVVFNKNYQGQVAGGLTTLSSKEEVKSALGNPVLVEDENLYGYLGEDSYLFFDFANQEISVYPVVKVNEQDAELLKTYIEELNSTSDVKQFATKLTGLWIDYDSYDYDSNYVDLKYTLKGVRLNISGNSIKNGVFIYQNYSGNKDILDLDNVYLEAEDFVVEEERQRAICEELYHTIEGEVEEDSDEEKARGNLFVVNFINGNVGPRFYNLNGEYPDSELERTLKITDFYWYDDYNFVYTVENDGTFSYNAVTREVTRIEN